MAATTVTVTGVIPFAGANNPSFVTPTVTFIPSAVFANAGQAYTQSAYVVQCASSGSFTINLPANNDPGTVPSTTYYNVQVFLGTLIGQFNGVVSSTTPYASAGTVGASATTLNLMPIVLSVGEGTGTVLVQPTSWIPTIQQISNSGSSVFLLDATNAGGAVAPTVSNVGPTNYMTLCLPPASQGGACTLKAINSPYNYSLVQTLDGSLIDGLATTTVGLGGNAVWQQVDLVSDGTMWRST